MPTVESLVTGDFLNLDIYGDSGAGKSTFLRKLLEWFREKDPTFEARLLSAEHVASLKKPIKEGYLHYWRFNDGRVQAPFEALEKVCKGWWIDEKGKLQPPNADTFKKVKALFIEGTATIGNFLAGNTVEGGLAAKTGKGTKVGPQEESIRFKDGDREIGGNPRTHYNIVQRWMKDCIETSQGLPCHMVWTSHEIRAQDKETKEWVVGPEIFGEAATPKLPRLFANILRLTSMQAVVKGKTKLQYRLYLKDHEDDRVKGVTFKAKNAIPAELQDEKVPEYLEGGGLMAGKFMDMLFSE